MDSAGMGLGAQGAVFKMNHGVYYLAIDLAVDSTGAADLTSEIVPQ